MAGDFPLGKVFTLDVDGVRVQRLAHVQPLPGFPVMRDFQTMAEVHRAMNDHGPADFTVTLVKFFRNRTEKKEVVDG